MMAIRLGPSWFTVSGLRSRHVVEDALARHGTPLVDQRSVLDFGCGAGRVLRHLRDVSDRVGLYGTDLNPALIEWCEREIPFARFVRNGLDPPLPFGEADFGAV